MTYEFKTIDLKNSKSKSFNPIDNIEHLDLETKAKVYLYVIDKIEQLSEENGEVILDHSNKKELTMVTCLGYRVSGRLVIHGNLKSVKDYNNQTDKIFNQPFNQWYK